MSSMSIFVSLCPERSLVKVRVSISNMLRGMRVVAASQTDGEGLLLGHQVERTEETCRPRSASMTTMMTIRIVVVIRLTMCCKVQAQQ